MRIINIMAFLLLASTAGAQESLDKLISEKLAAIECEKPTEADPLSLNAGVVSSGDSVAVIIKADIAEGWHIYQLVPEHLPYVATEYVLRLPENISADGKWSTSDPRPSNTDRGVLIHEGGVWFVYKTTRTGGASGPIKTGLYYQTCDHRQCLPPVEKIVEIK